MSVTLSDLVVSVDDLFLDPNNPRYADLGVSRIVPEHKVIEDSVQQTALARMLEDQFEVAQLKESIEKMGLLRVDRLVAVELPQTGKYLVVEGNRRLAAAKALLAEQAAGEVDLSETTAASVNEIHVLLIEADSPEEREEHARNLQGIRHIAGVKAWGAYQQAQAVGRMLDEGMTVGTIRSALGLTTPRVNLLRYVYLAMKQMRLDPDFAEHARPGLFSYFVEALNRPQIREWVGWDKEEGRMENEAAREKFYGLVVGMEDEEGVTQPPKVVDAKDFRLLPVIMQDSSYFEGFLSDPIQSLQDAYKAFAAPPPPPPDWKSILRRDLQTLLNNVPHTAIKAATQDDRDLLVQLRDTCAQFVQDIDLSQGPNG